jgi:hypothetical protein
MNSKIISLVLFFVLISSSFMMLLPASKAVEPVRVYVDPPSVVDPPVFFNVSVKLDNVENLYGVQFILAWDPLLLRAIKMTEIMYHETMPESEWENIWRIRNELDNFVGFAEYCYMYVDGGRALEGGYSPISGNHTIATILFQVIGIGNCSLHFTLVNLGDLDTNSIQHENVDGFFSNSLPLTPIPPSPIDDAQVLVYVYPRRVRDESIAVNDTFEIAVKCDRVSNDSGLYSIQFSLKWDPKTLQCIGVEEMMFHEALPESEWEHISWYCSIDSVLGQLGFEAFLYVMPPSELPPLAIYGNHTIATFTFRVNDFGKCAFHLFDCVPQEVDPRTLYGNVMLYATFDGYFSNTLNGDLNSDNRVDLFDAVSFAGSYGRFPGYPGWNEEADMNGDGTIDLFDAIMLGQCFGHSR